MSSTVALLDEVPRRGWVTEPTPVTGLDDLAAYLGLDWLGVKRDDRLAALGGGTKPRKLDYLLATEMLRDAPGWVSMGAIGSGHLVALTQAAAELDRRLFAHCFWEPLSDGVVDNLAATASGPTELAYYGSRLALGLRRPKLLLSSELAGLPVIPPGGTTPDAMLGLVRAGLELGEQIRAGELPLPDRVYVALGTGGTAVGLAAGLGLAGVKTRVHAVGVVERVFITDRRVRALGRALAARLAAAGIAEAADRRAVPIVIERRQLGAGYARTTIAGRTAVESFAAHGLRLEPVYTGKAAAALLADAARKEGGRYLLWLTAHGGRPQPDDDWEQRLPEALRRRLERGEGWLTRRKLIFGGAAVLALGVGTARLSGYPPLPQWRGRELARWEAHVVRAAGEALLPPSPAAALVAKLPGNLDRYVATLPKSTRREVHAMFALVEHGTTPLGLRLSRFTELSVAARRGFIEGLERTGGIFGQAARGLRDLVMLAAYQEASMASALGYAGPWEPLEPSAEELGDDHHARYQALLAPDGAVPKGQLK